jgi:hypothetical protein
MAATQFTPSTAFPYEADPALAELLFRYVTERRDSDLNEICRRSLHLVKSKARKVRRKLDDRPHTDDLVSAGNYAMFLAVRRLPQKLPLPASFANYISGEVKSDMYREWYKMAFVVKGRERKRYLIVDSYRALLRLELGHDPNDEELEARLRRDYPQHYEDTRPVKIVMNGSGHRPHRMKIGSRAPRFNLHPVEMKDFEGERQCLHRMKDRQPTPLALAISTDVVEVACNGLLPSRAALLRLIAQGVGINEASRRLGVNKGTGFERWAVLRAALRKRPDLISLLETQIKAA